MNGHKIIVPKTFAVIGAGPSGCVLAAFLAKGGYKVIFCDIIKDLVDFARNPGIKIDGCEKIEQRITNICSNISDIHGMNPDVIFVATKATALPLVTDSLRKIHREGVYIVSWQNGIDTEEELSKEIAKKWVIRAVVNYGCSLVAPAHSHISFHHPPHYLQEMTSNTLSKNSAKAIANSLKVCGLNTKYTYDIKSMIWHKAILNAAMNPVCAVTGLTMYEAMREPSVFKIVDSLLKECILVAKENGISNIDKNFYNHAINYMGNAGNHKPSMLMDIENKRVTEIDYINGKFEKYGKLANIETPYNSMFKNLVNGLESKLRNIK